MALHRLEPSHRLGRGLGALKKDVTFDRYGTAGQLAGHPDYDGVEVPEGYSEQALEIGEQQRGAISDEQMGASTEPPVKAPPLGSVPPEKGV